MRASQSTTNYFPKKLSRKAKRFCHKRPPRVIIVVVLFPTISCFDLMRKVERFLSLHLFSLELLNQNHIHITTGTATSKLLEPI